MTIGEGIVLGLVQGLTEFIPVSSSGHLVILRHLFGITEGGLAFDAALHLATALAVLVYFRKDVWGLLVRAREHAVLWWSLVLGTVPAVFVGVLFGEVIEMATRSVQVVAWALIVGSLLFVVAERLFKDNAALSPKKGFIIGLYQALAFVPGVSRSGASISGGLLLGLSREQATRFAFLLSFPIILSAGGLKLVQLFRVPEAASIWPLMFGSIVAFVVGVLSIHFMLRFLRKRTLYPFVVYRLVLAFLFLFFL